MFIQVGIAAPTFSPKMKFRKMCKIFIMKTAITNAVRTHSNAFIDNPEHQLSCAGSGTDRQFSSLKRRLVFRFHEKELTFAQKNSIILRCVFRLRIFVSYSELVIFISSIPIMIYLNGNVQYSLTKILIKNY